MFLHQILASTMHGKNIKNHTKTINFKYKFQRGVINLNYLMDNILY